MGGKHFCVKEKKHHVKKIFKSAILFIFLILLALLCFFSGTYGKYVVNKEVQIGVKTAEYYFSAEPENGEFITKERN